MIPMIYFLIAWLVFLGIFLVLAGLSIWQMLRFGLNHPVTHISTAFFVLVIAVVVIGTLGYLSGMDFKSGVDINSFINPQLAPTL